MFGYVKAYKDELKIKEYNVYRSYYCGLCKTLKDEYGFFSRFALNYDSVFLAILLSSLEDECHDCHLERCIANPFKKRPVASKNSSLSYSAAVMMILALLKLSDDIKDEHSIKACFLYTLLLPARHRLNKTYGSLYKKCKAHIKMLSELETNKESTSDALSHTFASLLEFLFVPDFLEEENTQRILRHIGYTLGRFIYILDAYEDIERDKKKRCFNMFLNGTVTSDKEVLRESLTLTLSTLAGSYELLKLKANKSILDNIIYLGLSHVLDDVLDKANDTRSDIVNEKSL